jgi:hypothetical protein
MVFNLKMVLCRAEKNAGGFFKNKKKFLIKEVHKPLFFKTILYLSVILKTKCFGIFGEPKAFALSMGVFSNGFIFSQTHLGSV